MNTRYATFVRERFKCWPNSSPLTLHHATTGLVNEAVELLFADSHVNIREELGDFEFYLQALKDATNFAQSWDGGNPRPVPGLLVGLQSLLWVSNQLLDLTKKGWVYEKHLSVVDFWRGIAELEAQLVMLYACLGLSRDAVIDENIAKLLRRYPTGYSNQAAQARADKENGQ